MRFRNRQAEEADLSTWGESAHRAARRQTAALWATGILWLVLVAWCGHLLVTVGRLRHEVEERVAWMFRAASFNNQALHASALAQRTRASRKEGLLFRFPPGLRHDLEGGELLARMPREVQHPPKMITHWQTSAAELLAIANSMDGEPLSGPEGARHAASVRRLDDAASRLEEAVTHFQFAVRRGVEARVKVLLRKWHAIYILAALSIAGLGALAWLIWRARREALLMRVKERRFRTLVQSAQDLIWSLDAKGRWTFVNDAARRIYGYDPKEMLGRPFTDFSPPRHVEKEVAAFKDILRGESKFHYEVVHLAKDGRPVTLLFNATPMLDARGRVTGTMGTATDVTQTRAMQERLLLNERLQAVATLGGGVAHDFNNLLTVIIGQAEVAKARTTLTPFLLRRLDSILDTAERARKLTQQLIAFARRQPLRREIVDLVAVVREMGDLTLRIAGEGVSVEEVLPEDPVKVVADWGQLEQVLINLVVNARDAMPGGGTVTIRLETRALEGGEAKSLGVQPGAWASLDVIDDGTGIEEEILPHIFDPFFTTKEPGKGTGLGLATVHGVISQHGGTITVESRPGEGTRMRILLPVANEETFEPDEETTSNPEPVIGSVTASNLDPR